MRWSNCLVFALRLWWRRLDRPGYILMRRSRWGAFPHFLYQERRPYGWRIVSFIPANPRRRRVPPPVFRGRVRWGDAIPEIDRGPH